VGWHVTPSQESMHGLVELTQVDNAFDESNKEDLKESNAIKSGFDKELEKMQEKKKKIERKFCLDNIFFLVWFSRENKQEIIRLW
jgi:DNA mismatch repair ATPase MutS